jgi:predicted Zn-dependent protease with MMP-like domain
MEGPEGSEARLARAWEAYDLGDLETAIELTRELDPGLRDGWVLLATAMVELGDARGARAALARAAALGEGVDLEWVRAELELAAWEIGRARARYERIAEQEPCGAVFGRLSLCAEIDGDLRSADRFLARARELDPEEWPRAPRLSPQEFEAVLDRAVARLPRAFREALDDVQILVEPVPRRGLVDLSDPFGTPPEMLGLFTGSSLLERSVDSALEIPPTVHLFQRNLERAARDREELVEEIAKTLYHELGHALGFDEHGVAEMGLE